MNIILQDCESIWPDIGPQNKCRSLWPIFHGPVILPYILKTVWYMNTILWDYESIWRDVRPNNKCKSLTYYFMVQWFCFILWRLFDVWTSYFSIIMSQYDLIFYLKINVGHCVQHFVVRWLCLISWRLCAAWTLYFGIMSQYDTTFNLKINIGHRDLYFMVHWICLISWRLFDIWTPYFGIMNQFDPMFDLKINIKLLKQDYRYHKLRRTFSQRVGGQGSIQPGFTGCTCNPPPPRYVRVHVHSVLNPRSTLIVWATESMVHSQYYKTDYRDAP